VNTFAIEQRSALLQHPARPRLSEHRRGRAAPGRVIEALESALDD
jgi:hypothetical protein